MDEIRYKLELLKAMNQKITETERMYSMICETSNNAFFYYNYQTKQLNILGKWNDFFECELKDIRDLPKWVNCVDEPYRAGFSDFLNIEKDGKLDEIMQATVRNGKKWIEMQCSINYNSVGRPTDKVVRIKDITTLKKKNDELSFMAFYDALSGLFNRNYFVKKLKEFVDKAERCNSVVSVMILDIDDFRKINDGIGLLVGDDLIQQFGQFLKSLCNDNIIAGHFNSDLFCIAIYDPCGSRSVETIHNTIRERLSEGFTLLDGQNIKITVSVGVVEYPEAASTELELINCAEIVMFKSKHRGKDTISYYDARILNDFIETVALENKLKTALFSNSFFMYYQPQFYSDSKRIRGVEALIRWRDNDGRMISPAHFIPIAEQSGIIIPIGDWVMEESVRTFAAWREKFGCDIILSINISAIQYKKDDFVDKVLSVLKRYDVPCSNIELEITESVLIDDFENVKVKLLVLREYGIRVALDDFGTGFSSMSYLNGLPIDTLKIDKTFIDNVVDDESSKIITGSMIDMVNRLGYETIAEGVETEEQYQYLKDIGCEVIQGFLFSKPIPGEKVEELLDVSWEK